jgi:hypothetical protein
MQTNRLAEKISVNFLLYGAYDLKVFRLERGIHGRYSVKNGVTEREYSAEDLALTEIKRNSNLGCYF